ncbi:MAG TPA: hypothetical protein GXX47_09575 [Firmicutes bacterium]|nr:hypothetical protein [Bacillota bacterium]
MALALLDTVTEHEYLSSDRRASVFAGESTLTLLLRQRPLLLLGWGLFFLGIPLASTIVSILLLLLDSLVVLVRTRVFRHQVAGPPIFFKQEESRKRQALILFSLLGLWAVIGSLLSIRPDIALPSTIGLTLIISVFFFRAGDLLWEDRWILRRTMPFLVIGLLASSIYGVYASQIQRVPRLELIGHGPNGSGTCLLISILLAWSYADSLTKPWTKLGVRLIALAGIPSLLFTQSRGAWLGFAGGAVFYSLLSGHRRNWIWLLVGVVIISVIVQANPSLQRRMQRIFSLELNKDRIEVWTVTLKFIPDHLVFGVGTAVFPHVYQRYSPRGNAMSFAHNFFLQALAEYGIPGLLLSTAVIGLSLTAGYHGVKRCRWPFALGVLSAVIGTLIHQQVDNTIHGANLASIFWLLCGFLVALRQEQESAESCPLTSRGESATI